MNRLLAVALVALGALAISLTVAAHRHARPPVPDAMPASIEAEKRVERHVYLLHGLTDEGVAGPWVCEPANVGTLPQARRTGR